MRQALALPAVLLASHPTPAQVVRQWSADLNANRNAAAAALFATGAHVIQGGSFYVLTRQLALAFNTALPCAGRIERLQVKGQTVVAVFRLGERPRHRCDGPGQEAAALFVIRGGKIVLWEQVAVPPRPRKTTAPPA